MSTFIAIAGSPKAGITVLKTGGAIARLEAAAMPTLGWTAAASSQKALAPLAALSTTAGGVTTLAVQDSIDYLTNFNGKSQWKKIDPTLPDNLKTMKGAAGESVGGYMVLSDDGKPWHVDADSKAWKALAAPLPFKVPQAALVAGDRTGGFVVVSTDDQSFVALSSADLSTWTLVTGAAPIKLTMLTGDVKNGFLAFGEDQLYTLKIDKDKDTATWTALATPDFTFVGIAGNPVDGIAALVNARADGKEGDLVVYWTMQPKDAWALALVAGKEPAPATAAS